MRLPYVSNPPLPASVEDVAIVRRLDVSLMAGHSFSALLETIVHCQPTFANLPILRVAALTGSKKYEINEYTPYAKKSCLSDYTLKEIAEGRKIDGETEGRNEEQWAAVKYAEDMATDAVISDEVFGGVERLLNNKQVVELATTVAAINFAARFLRALDVGEFDEEAEK